MHIQKGRQGSHGNYAAGAYLLARMALALLAMLTALCAPALAAEAEEVPEDPTPEIKAAVETFLRSYEQEAMLYEATDQRAGTVYEPQFVPAWEGEKFLVNGKEAFLTDLQKNIQYLEKKAAFYAAMRQMQNIYREDLQLHYTYNSLRIEEYCARASVKQTATFYYTGSSRRSIRETAYTVDLVKFTGRWLIADVREGSMFDSLYKSTPDFDLSAVLEEFAAGLKEDAAVLSYPYTPDPGAADGRILYNGQSAAAYASTYCRQSADTKRDYYNSQFKAYAGLGGDCMNFTSQCLWAGFGGSQTAAAINGRALPMDTKGASTWYGRSTAAGTKDSDIVNWISCAGFWKYLNGDEGKTVGTNNSADTGMYASVVTVPMYSRISGVSPEELVGAAVHVAGSSGKTYSHAIILTAATGNSRSEIWYCSHTADEAHVKLGDYYFGPIRVYIPRYMRVNEGEKPVIQPERIAPVLVNTSNIVGFRTETAQPRLSVVVQAPDGTRTHAALSENAAVCSISFPFTQTGLYRVECVATSAEGGSQELTYYIRCVIEGIRNTNSAAVQPAMDPEAEAPGSIVPEEEAEPQPEAEGEPSIPFPDMPEAEIDISLLPPAA